MKLINNQSTHPIAWLLLLGFAILLSACGGGSNTTPIPTSTQIAELDGIQILVEETHLIAGLQTQAFAVALYSDNSSVDLSNEAQWFSFDSDVASIDDNGVITASQPGSTVISAVVQDKTASISLNVETGQLLNIDVSPSEVELAMGVKQQFSAEGQFTNGGSILNFDITDLVTWASDNTDIASISNDDSGLVTAQTDGSTEISATLNGIRGSAQLTVNSVSLNRIEISAAQTTLPAGSQLALNATGVFSDNSQFDLTEQVNWQSSNTAIARPDASGKLTTISAGTVIISASYQGQSSTLEIHVSKAEITSIEISPVQLSLISGEVSQLYATAIYSDGSSLDVTQQTTWNSSATTVATIGNTFANRGEVTAANTGETEITAHFNNQSHQSALTVSNASLLGLEITPSSPSIAVGTHQRFGLTGHYNDGSTRDLTQQASWSSNNINIVDNSDESSLFKALSIGNTFIIATINGVSAFTELNVSNATLTSITLSPTNVSIPNGFETQITATGHFSDASSQDISQTVVWQSSDETIASINNATDSKGILNANAIGNTSISATFSGITQSASVTVTDAELQSISIQTQNNEMNVGTHQILTAIGHFSDSKTLDISNQVTWSSSDNNIVAVSNAQWDKGKVTALDSGNIGISAFFRNITNSSNLAINSDLNAPVSMSITSSNNVILNNGIDTSTITITLKPADNNGSIADNMPINIKVIEGGNSTLQTIYTSNGSANFTLTSNYLGFISIEASVANSTLSTAGYIYSTTNFSNVIAADGFSFAIYEGSTIKTDSWFSLTVLNFSNRSFSPVQYIFSNGNISIVVDGKNISNGQFNGSERFGALTIVTHDQADNGITGELTLKDPTTNQTFIISATFTSP